MQFVDTHCHIHEANYPIDAEAAFQRARQAGVEKILCIGTDVESSTQAIKWAERDNVWAVVGIHPHEAVTNSFAELQKLFESHDTSKIVGIGECGLDYFYEHSPREAQITLLHQHLELAQKHNLPVSFHVREAFTDFWPIFDQYPGLRGVLHSFTDTKDNLEKALARGLYIGVNGISTFTKSEAQKNMFASIPLEKMLLETDAPFLTPVPKRGTINEPAFVTLVAKFQANLRSINLEELSQATSQNATDLFSI
ncbi:MAG TPA: TatD family hydrolase [Verrucomicrobiae bacterium]|nr:TatD family hydrolase [Verrucomicrobiae bacterium]